MSRFEDRAAAALSVDGGLSREEAERLVAVLAKARVLRTETGLDRVEVDARKDGRTRLLIQLEDGRRWTGVGDYEFLGPIYAWANPFDEAGATT